MFAKFGRKVSGRKESVKDRKKSKEQDLDKFSPQISRKLTPKDSPRLGRIEIPNKIFKPLFTLLTAAEIAILRSSWKQLKGSTGLRKPTTITTKIFDKTFLKIPSAKKLFATAAFTKDLNGTIVTVHDHSRLVARLFDCILGESSSLEDYKDPKVIGSQHACLSEIGFSTRIWDIFGQCCAAEMGAACPKGARAWNLFLATFTDQLNAGFEERRKKDRYGVSLKSLNSAEMTISRASSDEVQSSSRHNTWSAHSRNTIKERSPTRHKFSVNALTVRRMSKSMEAL